MTFANKIELAKRMLQRAFAAGIPARWVVADSFYGRSHEFRKWLEERGRPYAVMVPKTNAVRIGGRRKKIDQLAERLPEGAWSEVLPAEDAGKIDALGSGLAWSYPLIRRGKCVGGYWFGVTPKTRTISVSTRPTAPKGPPSRNSLRSAKVAGL